jgi:hypothetical protein
MAQQFSDLSVAAPVAFPVDQRIALYRMRAEECRGMAEHAFDREARDRWLTLANQWTVLALRARSGAFDMPELPD